MASVTLVESAKLSQDDLVAGVIENIITVNQMFRLLPFDGIEGNSLAYNRENVLGAVATFGVGDSIGVSGTGTAAQQAAKDAATFSKVNVPLTTILGDAEVNGLIQATRSNITDQTATQVASKAKNCGRSYQTQLIAGDSGSVATDFDGLGVLAAAGQTIIQDTSGATTNGGPLSFEKLDEMLDLVTVRDGQVDYIIMPARTRRSFKGLARTAGGTSALETIDFPGIANSDVGPARVLSYEGIPIFRNDYIPLDETQGSLTTGTSIYAGTLDDGSREGGLAGLTASEMAGIRVVEVGESETKDESITRVKWYASLALFSEKALSRLRAISN